MVVLTGASSNFRASVARLHQDLPTALERPVPVPIRLPDLRRRLTFLEREFIAKQYEAGAGQRELARAWQLSRGTVVRVLREQGVVLRQLGLTDKQVKEAAELYRKGQPLARLGDRYDVNADTVRLALTKRDVQMRRPWERL